MLIPILVAGLLGTFIGSFLNVCVHRLPRNVSVVVPPSRCGACGTRLPWHDNLPIVGWLLLRGRCRACGTSVSVRYLLAEVACGALTAGTVAWVLHRPCLVTGTGWDPVLIGAGWAAVIALGWWLAVCAFIDIDHTIIPDELTKSWQWAAPLLAVLAGTNGALDEGSLPLAWGIHQDVFGAVTPTPEVLQRWVGGWGLASVVLLWLSPPVARAIYARHGWSEDDHRGFAVGVRWFAVGTLLQTCGWAAAVQVYGVTPWTLLGGQALLGSLAGWMSLYLVGFIGTVALRKNAMGFGDVKFLAPIGAFVGPLGVVYVFFVASVVGCLVGVPRLILGGGRQIPFGPFLAVGTVVVLVAGGWIHAHMFAHLAALGS